MSTSPTIPPIQDLSAEADRPIGLDLFGGAGGLSLGFEQAGFDIAASIEYDPVHAATHAFNFPMTKVLCADLAKLSTDAVLDAVQQGRQRHEHSLDWNGEIDAIFGGPPCQGFSSIGKRLIDDDRNQLVFHFFRIVSELRPRYFVMENVPGMRRGGHAGILDQLIAEFEAADYKVHRPIQVLNASNYGVPQDRSRLFIIGARKDQQLPDYPDWTARPVPKRAGSESPSLRFDESIPSGPTVWEAIRDLPNVNDFPRLVNGDSVRLTPERLAEMERVASAYVQKLRGLHPDPTDLSRPRQWDRALLTGSMRTRHTAESIRRFASTRCGDTEPISRFYRPDPNGLCNTLRSGTGSERGAYTSPRPLHPKYPRVLSVREAARLHSFPDWFRFHVTKWHGFRQIGNAVAPLVGRAVAGEVVKAMGLQPRVASEPMQLGDQDLLELTMRDAALRFHADPAAIPPPRKRLPRENHLAKAAWVSTGVVKSS